MGLVEGAEQRYGNLSNKKVLDIGAMMEVCWIFLARKAVSHMRSNWRNQGRIDQHKLFTDI